MSSEPKVPTNREIVQQVRSSLTDGSRLTVGFVVINCLATVVACYGLLANSTAVVIGAMLIATLLGPIAGLALGLVDGNGPLLRSALLTELVGIASVVGLAFIVGTIHRDLPISAEMISRTQPNLLDLIIALAGGAAMAYAILSPKLPTGVVGVAIATALVPPLSTCGLLLARGEHGMAGGAFLLFFANLVAIEIAVSAVLWLFGFRRVLRSSDDRAIFLRANVIFLLLLAGLAFGLTVNLDSAIQKNRFEAETRRSLESGLSSLPGRTLRDVIFVYGEPRDKVTAVVYTPVSLTPENVAKLESALPLHRGRRPRLHVYSIIVKEATKDGFRHLDQLDDEATNSPTEVPQEVPSLDGELRHDP